MSTALRGVQKDSEVSVAKLNDLRKEVTTLQDRLASSLPQVLAVLEACLQQTNDGKQPLAGQDTSLRSAADSVKKLLGGESSQTFVSLEIFRKSLGSNQQEMKEMIEKLQRDLAVNINAKADRDGLRALAEQMTKQEQNVLRMVRRLMAQTMEGGPQATDAALVRWPLINQGKCIACDAKVDLTKAGILDVLTTVLFNLLWPFR